MDRIYLDFNCYQRHLDDQSQRRVVEEAKSCQIIFRLAEDREAILIGSFMLNDECAGIRDELKRARIQDILKLCDQVIGHSDEIMELGGRIESMLHLKDKDSLHLAIALHANSGYFLTCDDEIVRKSKGKLHRMQVLNPRDYVTFSGGETHES